jgi:peptide-methionine (S)-S-oxide reductase
MFGFKWPFGGSSNESSGENSSVLQAARVARKRGCELAPREAPEGYKLATFAGGCFWGLELAFQRVPGVVKTSVGYTQGKAANPTYEEVCMGFTGHTEAVQVTYDPMEVRQQQQQQQHQQQHQQQRQRQQQEEIKGNLLGHVS